MNPVHFKSTTPPNSPEPFSRLQQNALPYDDRADESESESEELYADMSDKGEGQGQSIPIPIPQKKTEVKVNDCWNIVYFGD